jgi:hypothetical protein
MGYLVGHSSSITTETIWWRISFSLGYSVYVGVVSGCLGDRLGKPATGHVAAQ